MFSRFLLLSIACLVPVSTLAGTDITGTYRNVSGSSCTIELTVTAPPPAAFIVQQHLPEGSRITAASPNPSGYRPGDRTVKWLFKHPQPGSTSITITLSRPVASQLRGDVRFRHPASNATVTHPIR